ncbi:MAG: ETC complex I subunit [Alphaproteobacteria bacterium]|nr:ETC complex I subunit [Alphaproteobacteria bacterium]
MKVKIYKPSKNVMQSGRAKLNAWVLEYERDCKRDPETLMGWTSSSDTLNQVRLKFKTLEDAEAYAKEKSWDYEVMPAHKRVVRPRNYGDNFKYIPPASEEKA